MREPFEESKMETKLLSTVEAAALLNLKPQTLEIWRIRGKTDLPYRKIGTKTVRYAESDVIAYMNRDVRTSTSQKPRHLAAA